MDSKQQFGRYTIIRELGRGGMATVYLARDPRFDTDVALKVLPRQFAHDATFRARFEREARAIANLREHPAILPVYDFGTEDDQPYLVMQYMRGGTLADRLAHGALNIADALPIVGRIASALDYAHQQGIVHRDLKPANILFDQFDQPYLSDFGIAKLAQETHSLTLGVLGTPAYMSPEQVDATQPVDWRTDIYTLGIILYEMLTGKQPYQADTPVKVMMAHVMQPVPRVRAGNPAVTPAVEAVVTTALAKDKTERFAAAGTLAQALQTAVAQTTAAQTTAPQTTAPRPAADMSRATLVLPQAPPVVVAEDVAPPVATGTDARMLPSWWKRMPAWVWGIVALAALAGVVWAVTGGSGRGLDASAAVSPLTAAAITSSQTPETIPESGAVRSVVLPGGSGAVDMVYVPAGAFMMGSGDGASDEQPLHQVFLDAYWIDRTEVTNAQYALCVEDGPCQAPESSRSYSRDRYYGDEAFADYPVISVSWSDADAYCTWRDARLPTEAEWEKAARGVDQRTYPWGNGAPTCENVNFNIDCVGDTSKTSSYPAGAGPYNAVDMAGNVWEWVADWYQSDYYASAPDRNPTGPASGDYRVLRGGAWTSVKSLVRAANRHDSAPSSRSFSVGFRCAQAVQSP